MQTVFLFGVYGSSFYVRVKTVKKKVFEPGKVKKSLVLIIWKAYSMEL